MTPTRFHPVLVALHWLLAVLIVSALALGALVMARLPTGDLRRIEALRSHMSGGMLILVLMYARTVVRLLTERPAEASTGNPLLDKLARASHRMFYVVVFGMAGSGIFMALQLDLVPVVFGGVGTLPADFWIYPVRTVHYLISRLLMALIALHIAGVLFHTFIRRDRLLRRMVLGRRIQGPAV